MKNLLLFALTVAFCATAFPEGKQVPYRSTFFQDTDWTVINDSTGTKTWEDIELSSREAKKAGYPNGKEYRYDRKCPADDWLIGPAIRLEAGKEYKVSFTQDVDARERFSLSMAHAGTVEALSAPDAIIYDFEFSDYGWQRISKVIRPAATADYYFGFHAYSPEYEDAIVITGFEVKENVFAPAAPGNFTATPDINEKIEVLLNWTLPTQDSDGADLPENASLDKVEVFRDGVLIQTLPGDALSFTDTEALGLTAGKHKYGVSVTINGVASSRSEIESRHIGPIAAFALPWTAGIAGLSADDFATYYATVKGDASQLSSSKGWSLKSGYVQFYPSTFDREDDWLMLPKVKFEKPGIYRLRMEAEYNESKAPLIEVYKGTGKSIASQTEKLAVIESLPSRRGETYVAFEIEEAGEFNLSLHAARPEGPSAKSMKFYDFVIEETVERPLAVSELKVTVSSDTARISLKAPAKSNVNRALASLSKIELYRNGDLIAALTQGIEPGKEVIYDDILTNGGIYTYHAVPYVGDMTPDTDPEMVTSPWIGDKTQSLPYELDFAQSVDTDIVAALWDIRNNDNDSYKWSIGSSAFTLSLNDYDGGKADDMLLTPPFRLKSGEYDVTLNIKGGESEFPLIVGFVMEGADTIAQPQTIILSGRNSYADYTGVVKAGRDSKTLSAPENTSGRSGRLAIYANGEYGYDLYDVMLRKIAITPHESSDPQVGVDTVTDSMDSTPRYYDLNGLEVANPQKGNIYIVRYGDGTVRKMIRQ